RVVVAALLVVLLAGLYILVLLHISDKDWRDAVAEADRLDPGWRFEELEAKRAILSDEHNGALRGLAAHDLLPNPWPPRHAGPTESDLAIEASLRTLAPTDSLGPETTKALTAVLEAAKAALVEARKLKDLPNGRYPVVYDRGCVPSQARQHAAAA